ncbi:MAG: hypothetical protein KDK08_05510 [Rhizobiaceae bacterium]|nr:hypothetical protein [Rhizobiaceae bacterium]MCC0000925.1 hypothetical protein [Methylobacteriaceae bacterium]
MQINLKRALKLRKELEATLAKVDLPSTGSINLLIEAQRTNPANMVVLAQAVYANKVAEYVKLSHILADLRIKLDEANISSGIHRILAEVADLDRRIGIYKKVVAERVAPNKELIEAEVKQKVADNAAPESRSYGRDRSIGFAVASVDMIEAAREMVAAFKRRKDELEDQRVATNARILIEIPEDTAELLTKLGLI